MLDSLFLWQNVRVVNLSITHEYCFTSLSIDVSRSSGNSRPNLVSLASNFGLGLRQFERTATQNLSFHCFSITFLQNIILRILLLISFDIISRINCLNITNLVFLVAFLLSVYTYSICKSSNEIV